MNRIGVCQKVDEIEMLKFERRNGIKMRNGERAVDVKSKCGAKSTIKTSSHCCKKNESDWLIDSFLQMHCITIPEAPFTIFKLIRLLQIKETRPIVSEFFQLMPS
jgi:hypothetical protein